MRPLLTAAFVLLCAASTPRAGAQSIPCETYRLANGMTVILHQDRSLPVAAVNVWYQVGAKDEPPGRSGFAHLFEHLMFMGTERVPGSQFDELMEAGGGANNASTTQDRTNYYSSGPSHLLPTLLWLEADRMEDLGRMMTQEKLDRQRDVVRNERRQSYENQPYGVGDLVLENESFPAGHPYHDSVIGSHEDLEAATVKDVQEFFATYYVASNASLAVGGDFDPAVVKPLIERWFGTLPTRPVPPHLSAAPVRFDGARRFVVADAVQAPRLTLAWHSPALWAEGDADLDLAAGVLATGNASRLERKLVHELRLATRVVAYQMSQRLGSLFVIEVTGTPESDVAALLAAIDSEVAALAARGPTEAELERVRNAIQRGALERLEDVANRIDTLNAYLAATGEPDSLARDLARYDRATVRSVRDMVARVLDPKARLIVEVRPENPRARAPEPGPAAAFAFPKPDTFTLANGLTVHHWERPDLPLVALRWLSPGGSSLDGAGHAGLQQLLLELLDEGTTRRGALEFAEALERLGAQLDSTAGLESASISLSSLSKNFPEALALVHEAIATPAFAESDVARVREQLVNRLREAQDDPTAVASFVSSRALFGDEHPFGRRATPESMASLGREQVLAAWKASLRPERSTLLVAGRVTRAELEPLLATTLGSFRAEGDAAPLPAIAGTAATPFRVLLVDRPGAVQTVVRFSYPGPSAQSPERAALDMLNTLFGQSFTSRLNANLREAHGYTYGAASRFLLSASAGTGLALSSVRADVTGASLGEFLAEFKRIRGGDVTDAERDKAAATVRNRRVDGSAGLQGLLGQAEGCLAARLPLSTLDEDLARLDSTTTADLNRLAARWLAPEAGVLVLVGDREQVLPQLAGLGLPSPIAVDVLGNPASGARTSAPASRDALAAEH